MDRERGDEIPYGEPMTIPARRKQAGLTSRFTAEQIAHIRDVYARWMAVRRERIRLTKTLDLGHSGFCRIGQGKLGKKPRD